MVYKYQEFAQKKKRQFSLKAIKRSFG